MEREDRLRRWGLAVPRDELEGEVAEELAFHIERRAERLVEAGMDPARAREEALARFGHVSRIQKECLSLSEREQRSRLRLQFLGELLADARYALRGLRRRPAFALSAVLTLALGIGAATAIYTLLDAVLVRALPYDQPQRLVSLWSGQSSEAMLVGFEALDELEAVAAHSEADVTLTGASSADAAAEPARLAGARVTPNFFATLGVEPLLGRGLVASDGAPGAPAVVVLSEGLWRQRLAGDRGVLDTSIELDGTPHTVVGVMPSRLALPHGDTDVWTAVSLSSPGSGNHWGNHYLTLFARLADGVDIEQAQTAVTARAERLRLDNPIWTPGEEWTTGAAVRPYQRAMAGDLAGLLTLLFLSVLAVLLVVCVNVANLFLGRHAARRQETAVRAALGAGRGRLFVQALVESWVVALLGTVLGLLLALALLRWLPQRLDGFDGRFGAIGLDPRILAFAVALSALTAVLFGTVPAWRASRGRDLAHAVRGTRGHSSGGRTGGALVVALLALSAVLLTGAGILLDGLLRQLATDTGIDAERVVAASLHPPAADYDEPGRRVALYRSVLEELGAAAAVESAAAADTLPFGTTYRTAFDAPDRDFDVNALPVGPYRHVTPGYLETMGIPLLRGRDLSVDDARPEGGCTREQLCAALIDQQLAEDIWPGEDALGRTIGADWQGWYEIVGVAARARTTVLAEESEPMLYLPQYQRPCTALHLVVRTRAPAAEVDRLVRAAVTAFDPRVPVTDVRTLADDLWASTNQSRLVATLLGAFAVVALLLAAVGIYGVMAYRAERRRREMGIRLALGSTGDQLRNRELLRVLGLAALGLVLGSGAVFVGLRFLGASTLLDSTLTDWRVAPGVLLLLPLVLLAASLLAGWLPARRATRVELVEVLRAD